MTAKLKTIVVAFVSLIVLQRLRVSEGTLPSGNSEMDTASDGTPIPKAYLDNAARVQQNLKQFETWIRANVDSTARIVLTSLYRTADTNASAGGAKKSYHLVALASDFIVQGNHANGKIYMWTHANTQHWLRQAMLQNIVEKGELGKGITHTHYAPTGKMIEFLDK
jgi:Peptidase M15